MKYFFLGLYVLLMSSQIFASDEIKSIGNDPIKSNQQLQQQQQQQQQLPEDNTPQILQQFGGVVISFLNILKDPDNKEHALTQVGNMVQGMFNIGMLATKRHDKELLKRKFQEFFETDEGKLFLDYWRELFNKGLQEIDNIA